MPKSAVFALSLLFAVALPVGAAAQTLEDYDYENLSLRGIGVELGSVMPHGIDRTLSLGVRADLGELGPNLRIVPRASYWSSSLRRAEVAALREQILRLCRDPQADCLREFGEVALSELVLGVDAHYTFPDYVGDPYLGAGVGVHFLNGGGELINGTFVEDGLDAVAPGIALVAGVELPLGSALRLFAEARGTLSSEVRTAGIHLGGTLTFAPHLPRGIR